MGYKDLFGELFAEFGLPVVIGSFTDGEVPTYPFIEYHRAAPDYTHADSKAFFKADNWEFSIYALKEDAPSYWELCDEMESKLNARRIDHERTGDIFVDNDVVYTTFNLALTE